MTITKPNCIRIQDGAGQSAYIIENPAVEPGFRDFYVMQDGYDEVEYLFGCVVESDEQAIQLAIRHL